MQFLRSYIEVQNNVRIHVQLYKTHLGYYYIKHPANGLYNLWIVPATIYRDPATGIIIAAVTTHNNNHDFDAGALIIYPDKTKHFIKDMSVNQAVQQVIFKPKFIPPVS
jgi:hypothetical protein